MNSFKIRLRTKDGSRAFRLSKDGSCEIFNARVINTPQRVQLVLEAKEKFRLISVEYEMTYPFEEEDRIFLNGYQSWTFSPEKTIHEADRSLRYFPAPLTKKYGLDRYGDGFFYGGSRNRNIHHGYSYAYVRNDNGYRLFGSLGENSGFTVIEFDTKGDRVTFAKDCSGRLVTDSYTAVDMEIFTGSEEEVFDGYFEALGIPKPSTPKMIGYTSWYNCYQDISAEKISADLEGIGEMPAKPDIFQIDDGFETFVGDWFDIDCEKFPQGLEPVIEQIKDRGMAPGIWLAPFLCEKDSKLFSEHEDWLLRDGDGRTVYTGCNWSGGYALDIYHPEVREYIKAVLGHYKSMGFRLFKLDFLYAACMLPRRDKTRGEIMCDAMDLLRGELDGCMILGCGVPLASAFGKVEFCRIGCDMTLDFDDKPYMRLAHNERPSTKNTMIDTVFRRQLSGRAFINDPDVFLLRDTNTKLSAEEKKKLAFVNALCGGLLFTSDNCGEYSEEAKQVFEQALALRDAKVTGAYLDRDCVHISYTLGGEERELY